MRASILWKLTFCLFPFPKIDIFIAPAPFKKNLVADIERFCVQIVFIYHEACQNTLRVGLKDNFMKFFK